MIFQQKDLTFGREHLVSQDQQGENRTKLIAGARGNGDIAPPANGLRLDFDGIVFDSYTSA
ncbi:hypothetical protein [Paenarthrobacter aurescens]|uniref:Uncharacterized protein n=1 Tax=Paenarthrobacter aurescens TaxID=43663 RepID=A0A4Y3NE30_PAEAU|nr:hypothetical protein [Paenarthrobacter aurescens]MDO6144904.1 hypothetical protein [Paenarthrobacter aurescens]MDO6148749.1 hypothetical protein [Paenarthrobacter aurescens]MDO6159995.1 hypothetical protein [Paenarthrobacter aurescens]MDO6163854.1 hypothetical protein [Paenarthrobacter aurescens]GEB17436.1 hypothetical protein AAU01_01910 [Paenarthrobacter aurescens]